MLVMIHFADWCSEAQRFGGSWGTRCMAIGRSAFSLFLLRFPTHLPVAHASYHCQHNNDGAHNDSDVPALQDETAREIRLGGAAACVVGRLS